MSKPMSDRTMSFLNKTQGRDKLCKLIQFGCRLLKYFALMYSFSDWAAKLHSLSENVKNSRKLFRLGKSAGEYHKLMEMSQKPNPDLFELTCQIIIRLAFFFFWFFDNVSILASIKVINKDPKKFGALGLTHWLVAIIVNLALISRTLLRNWWTMKAYKKQLRLNRKSQAKCDERQKAEQYSLKRQEIIKKLKDAKKKQFTQLLNLIRVVGDMMVALQGSEVFPKLFGFPVPEPLVGGGGLIAALIMSYQLYD